MLPLSSETSVKNLEALSLGKTKLNRSQIENVNPYQEITFRL